MAQTTAGCVLGVVGDVAVIIIIGISSILIRQLATPFQRGFFKDDESLMHPFKDSAVPASVLYGVGFSLSSLTILLMEGGWIMLKGKQGGSYSQSKSILARQWLWNVYRAALMFYFGVVVTHFSTNVPKYTIGRLRPHFFAVCVPDLSRAGNASYIEDNICTGTDTDLITEARVSFPSGHSSMAVYCMLFLVLYVQERFKWQGMTLLKPFLQMLCVLMALYTCLSRVSDYKHHWSDVLAGGLLGLIIAVLVFWSLRKSTLPVQPPARENSERGLLVQGAKPTNHDSTHATDPPPQSTAL